MKSSYILTIHVQVLFCGCFALGRSRLWYSIRTISTWRIKW